MRQASICIDQNALRHNLKRVKQLAPQARVVSMVKANAYGHGVEHCIAALADTDAFGVACLQEALILRKLGVTQPITLVEGIFSEAEMPLLIEHSLECMLHQQQQVEWLLAYKSQYQAQGLKVWVKLNSGMNRLGFNADDIISVIETLKQNGFNCVLTMHFANADQADHPLNQQQIQIFSQIQAKCAPILSSCCNSAAIFNWPDLHFDYVRPGIMLYGASPFAETSAIALGLQPVMSFYAAIIALHDIEAGEQIGYGSTFTATQAMKIAIVSIGYGDGYPRAYFTQNEVVIHGQKVALIGRVSMDMMAVDVSHIQVNLGDQVELWGKQNLVDDVAHANGTIGYELLCRLSNRPIRQMVK